MGELTLTGDKLVVAIRTEHEAASAAARSALEHSLECGRLLAQARAEIPHGGWEKYLSNVCGIAPRTGRLYLRLHAHRDRLGNRQRVAGLTIREAAKLVAEPWPVADVEPDTTTMSQKLVVDTLCQRPEFRHAADEPSWYRPGHFHVGQHPSGWRFYVWPHPAGEPWIHLVSLEPLGTEFENTVAAGPKRGLRSDAIVRILSLQTVNKMPPLSDPGWAITARPVDAEVVADEPHYNRWLFLDDEDYRVNGLGLTRKTPPTAAATA